MDWDKLWEVMSDSTGNYVVQEVFKIMKPSERIDIMNKIKDKVIDLSWHKKGTHSIQTLVVELKDKEEINHFLEIISGKELVLASNKYGTFIMQKVVDHFPEDLLSPIVTICRENFFKMATSSNGLPVIK